LAVTTHGNVLSELVTHRTAALRWSSLMDTFHQRCCGLDVHKKSVVACAITPEGRETHTFRTMTGDLLALADWLKERDVSQVDMESTGVYWKPVYNPRSWPGAGSFGGRVRRHGGQHGGQRGPHENGAGAQDRRQKPAPYWIRGR
jgi:hypothetical protein